MTTQLYRHFNGRGRLLYVGISLSAVERLRQHRQESHWSNDIARVTVTHYSTRQEALAAEAIAIQTERPLWNKAGAYRDPAEVARMKLIAKVKAKLLSDAVNYVMDRCAQELGGIAGRPRRRRRWTPEEDDIVRRLTGGRRL